MSSVKLIKKIWNHLKKVIRNIYLTPKSCLLLLSKLCALKLLSYSKNTFLTKHAQFLIIFFLTMTTHCNIYVH